MTGGTPVKRAVRVAERIRLELAELFLRGAVHDPRAAGAIVSRVIVTDDLSLATVYVRLLETDPSERRQNELVKALEGARGFLRREIGKRLTSKRTPDLRVFWDAGVERANRVEGILDELRANGELREDDQEDDQEDDDQRGAP